MIEKFMESLQAGDYKTLASYFAPHCRYYDYCPRTVGQTDHFVYGREAMEMFFNNRLTFRLMEVHEPMIKDENTAEYFVGYSGTYQYARATINEYDEDGRIALMTVRPA